MKGKRNTRKVVVVALITLLTLLGGTAPVGSAAPAAQDPAVVVTITPTRITWKPLVENGGTILTISGPDFYLQEEYGVGARPTLKSTDDAGEPRPDGVYAYELQVLPIGSSDAQPSISDAERGLVDVSGEEAKTYSGAFTVAGGYFVVPTEDEGAVPDAASPRPGLDSATADILHYDDVIITGSLCVGFDCQDGESFGFDTIILKEHNLRIYFNDTSYTASYPTNNWRITINDSTNGGASYFSIDDVDDGTSIFKIEAGAPSNSLYVEDYGRVGFGTSTPVVEAHIKDSDTPTVRLEQDGSGGWTPQTWDLAGNETNFFIRDVTNGSRLPFRIQPSAPSNSLSIRSDGDVGIGTWSATGRLDVVNSTGSEHLLVVQDGGNVGIGTTSPATKLSVSDDSSTSIKQKGLVLNNDANGDYLNLWNYAADKYAIQSADGSAYRALLLNPLAGNVGIGTSSPSYTLHVNGSAGKPGGGSWSDSSDARLKEHIQPIDGQHALDVLNQLQGVTFEWINPAEHGAGTRAGLVAQDVEQVFPDWVEEYEVQGSDAALIPAGERAKSVHFPHDFNAYMIEAVKALDAENQVLAETVAEQDAKIAALQQQNADLEARLTALEEAAGLTNGRTSSLPLTGLFLGGLLAVGIVTSWRRKQ